MTIQTTSALDVSASDFPIDRYYTFSGKTYLFKFRKNTHSNIYICEIYSHDGQTFLYSNKITYGQPLINSALAPFQDLIIPLNIDVLNGTSTLTEINDDTFGNQIKLYTNISEVVE